jgi:hypothetical protein
MEDDFNAKSFFHLMTIPSFKRLFDGKDKQFNQITEELKELKINQ